MGQREDALLNLRKHRTHNREHWQAQRLPRARCGGLIDYDGPQYQADGRPNPKYLIVGHKLSRVTALAMGWTADMINDITNTQPECWMCSAASGGGVQAQQPMSPPAPADPKLPIWAGLAPEAVRW